MFDVLSNLRPNAHCVIGSVVAYRRSDYKDASSCLGQHEGAFALPKNCLGCMCTYIYNRCIYSYICIAF